MVRFKKLANLLHTVVRILFWITVVAAVAGVIGSVVMAFMPASYFNTGNTTSLALAMDSVIKYRLDPPLTPVSLKPVFFTALLTSIPAFVLLALIFSNLAGILKTVKAEKPFAAENAKRLTVMGVVILASSVLVNVLQAAVVLVMVTTLDIANIDINYNINFTMLFMGLLLLILAGIFRYGNYLQDEVDSTL